ncbi:hypothetical protein HYU14_02120 [Candidatus Woesearchaeota archaeon]|nr:hypothetical protein [Candidatus Woesearchaeota archaeon]
MKRVFCYVLLFLLAAAPMRSAKTIEVNETQLVNLGVLASDPDQDALNYTFSAPFSEEGSWQTDYGDAGTYNITITVTDGELSTSEEVTLVVHKVNVAPEITAAQPAEDSIAAKEGESVAFRIEAADKNKDALEINWEKDNSEAGQGNDFSYFADYGEAGTHTIGALISDGEEKILAEWTVNVEKVDRAALLEGFHDITVFETETVSLSLPDFSRYGLEFEISKPLEDNLWQTTYDDSGEYDITVTIRDREFSASKNIRVAVLNKDRAPSLSGVPNYWIKETDQLTFNVQADDPDGDPITITAEGIPPGASFDGEVFTWKTNFDTIRKDNLIKKIADKFHLLYVPHKVVFTASSGESSDSETSIIFVNDVNRGPVLEPIGPIEIEEGERIVLGPQAADPDGDAISFSFKGFMDQAEKLTGFDDAGIYQVEVTASDGFLEDTQTAEITVREKNRAPEFLPILPASIRENETVEIKLKTFDPDGDRVSVVAEALPGGASLNSNIFSWRPDFTAVDDGSEVFTISLEADDGSLKTGGEFNITVSDVNRAPQIKALKPSARASAVAGQPIIFQVDADDPDGDRLSYVWNLGLFESYNASNRLKRTFTSPGEKEISVTVSDGELSAERAWQIRVVPPAQKKK